MQNKNSLIGVWVLIVFLFVFVLAGFGVGAYFLVDQNEKQGEVRDLVNQTKERIDLISEDVKMLEKDMTSSENVQEKTVVNSTLNAQKQANILCDDIPYVFEVKKDWNVYCADEKFEVGDEIVVWVGEGVANPSYDAQMVILSDEVETIYEDIIGSSVATEGPQSTLEVYYFEDQGVDAARDSFFTANGNTQDTVRTFNLFESIPTVIVESAGLYENYYYFTEWNDDVLMFYGGNEELIEEVLASVQSAQ